MSELNTIKVTYKSTRTAFQALQYLAEIKQFDTFAADFEVALKFTPSELDSMRAELDTDPPKRRRIQLEAALAANALSHPSYCTLTHCSIAVSDTQAYVFILDNRQITNLILNFLVTTPIKQVWHNASFDFRHIIYHTNTLPLDYEDTQIFAKTLVNHVEPSKAGTSLKDLCAKWYGSWAISSDNFDLSNMYDEHVLHYAAIDACATFKLWTELNSYCKEPS
jgi:hypothetical protein